MLKNHLNFENPLVWIVAVAIILMVGLTVATWDINYWPTDAEDYYIDAAKKLPALQYPSQMHEATNTERTKLLHGKEMFIVASAFFQRIYNDTQTLRPLIIVCILSVGFSSVLIFLITSVYWGRWVGLLCSFFFTTSFWPYVYILFVKHQPLGLFFFLLSLWILNSLKVKGKTYLPGLMMSGFCLCLSFYSSTVSVLYVPYYCAGFFYIFSKRYFGLQNTKGNIKQLFCQGAAIAAGFVVPFIYFNYPDILKNVQDYLEYSRISKSAGHFYYNQATLIQWVPHPELNVRGGWVWIIKYFFIIMPVLFPFYLMCLSYLLWRVSENWKDGWFRFLTVSVIILSLSSPLLAEWRGVSQYGANYFTSLVGIILLVGYALHDFFNGKKFERLSPVGRRATITVAVGMLIAQAFVNLYIFTSDVYPSRMVTTFLSKKIEAMGIKKIYGHRDHPCRRNIIGCLNPSLMKKIKFTRMDNINQIPEGYIVVPPVTGSSVYIFIVPFAYDDYDRDIYLNELLRKGNIQDYAVASYPSLSSSRIWLHEEEILTYRALVLNQFDSIDKNRGKVWLLDAKKLRRDILKNAPSDEYTTLVSKGIRNIGTKTKVYMYDGETKDVDQPLVLNNISLFMYKVGNPQDSFVAYVYRVKPDENIWVPLDENFASNPVQAAEITTEAAGQNVVFQFKKPLTFTPGRYQIVVYRTGKEDDNNFFRVYINNPTLTASLLKAARIPRTYPQN